MADTDCRGENYVWRFRTFLQKQEQSGLVDNCCTLSMRVLMQSGKLSRLCMPADIAHKN